MFKGFQSVMRKFRNNLEVPGRLPNIWIKYFTAKTEKTLKSIPKSDVLNQNYTSFNIDDVDMQTLLSNSDSVETDPLNSLPNLLNFRQLISSHYAKFCENLDPSNPKYSSIVDEVSVSLLRAFILLSFQMKGNIREINENSQSVVNVLHMLDPLPKMIKILLDNKEISSDTLFLIGEMLKEMVPSLKNILEKDEKNALTKAVNAIFDELLSYVEKNAVTKEDSESIVLFLIAFLNESVKLRREKRFCDVIRISKWLMKQKKADLINKDAFGKLLLLFTNVFNYISTTKEAKNEYIDLSINLLQLFALLSPVDRDLYPENLRNGGVFFSVINFLKWLSNFELKEDILSPKKQENSISFDTILREMPYFFSDKNLYDEYVEKNETAATKRATNIAPTYLAKAKSLVNCIYTIASICSKDSFAFTDFVASLLEHSKAKKTNKMLYIYTTILFTATNNSFSAVMNTFNAWKCIIVPEVINSFVFSGKAGEHLTSLKEMVLSLATIAFTSKLTPDSSPMLSAFASLLDQNDCVLMKAIVAFFNKLLLLDQERFCSSIAKTNAIGKIFDAYINYRIFLEKEGNKNKDKDKDECKQARHEIFRFMKQVLTKSFTIDYIYQNERSMQAVLSLLFEDFTNQAAINAIKFCLSNIPKINLMSQMNVLMKVGCGNPCDKKWSKLFSSIIHALEESSQTPNAGAITRLFVEARCLETFTSIPALYVDNERADDALFFLKEVIGLLLTFCKRSVSFQESLSKYSKAVLSNLEKALNSVVKDDDLIDLLISFALAQDVKMRSHPKSCEIYCTEGLSLLQTAVNETIYEQDMINFLADITEKSLTNRYQCYRANVIRSLFRRITEKSDPTTMKLLSQLGSSYFSMSELSNAIKIIRSVKEDYAIPLLKSMVQMIPESKLRFPSSYFHFGKKTHVFIAPTMKLNKEFTFSAFINIEANFYARDSFTLFSLASKTDKVLINVNRKTFVLRLEDDKSPKEYTLFQPMENQSWINFFLTFCGSKVFLYVNKQKAVSIELQSRFKFTDQNVSLLISGFPFNIEQIMIANTSLDPTAISTLNDASIDEKVIQKNQIIAVYSAQQFINGKCVNMIPGSTIEAASFNGLVVPYSLPIVESFVACGGPKVLLPLINIVEQAKQPQEYLNLLIEMIRKLAVQRPSMFLEARFFRSLGYLLTIINESVVTKEFINKLLSIYKVIKSSEIRSEIIRYIWGDIEIWSRLSDEMQDEYLAKFEELVKFDITTLYQVLPFRDLFKKVMPKAEAGTISERFLNALFKFLHYYGSVRFDEEDAKSLVASSLISSSNELLSRLIAEEMWLFMKDKNNVFVSYIIKEGVYSPLVHLLNSQHDSVKAYTLHMIFFMLKEATQLKISENALKNEMLNIVRFYSHKDNDVSMFDSILGYIFDIHDHKKDPNFGFKFDMKKKNEIKNPEFIALVLSILPSFKEAKIEQVTSLFLYILSDSESSRSRISRCPFWTYWMLYFCFLDKRQKEWSSVCGKIFASLIKEKYQGFSQDLADVFIICQANGMDTVSILSTIFETLFKLTNNQQVLSCAVDFLFFAFDKEEEPKKKSNILFFFSQQIMMKNKKHEPKLSFDYQSRQEFVNALVNYFLSFDHKLLAQNYRLFDVSYLGVCAVIIASCASSACLQKFILKCGDFATKDFVIKPCALLLEKFANDGKESALILSILQKHKSLQNKTIKEILQLQLKEQENTTLFDVTKQKLTQKAEEFIKQADAVISSEKQKLSNFTESLFVENESDRHLFSLRGSFKDEIANMETFRVRVQHGNAKFWEKMIRAMSNQLGSPWAMYESEEELHFMFSNSLDRIGRRTKSKINHNFTLHEDASALRDCSVDDPKQDEMKVKIDENVETDDSKIQENMVQIDCKMVTTLYVFNGSLYIGKDVVIFESMERTENIINTTVHVQKVEEIPQENIYFILKRRYLHIDNSLELFTTEHKSYFFCFKNGDARMAFMKAVKQMKPKNLIFIQFKDALKFYNEQNILKKWQSGEMSNYEYLWWVNIIGGRSIHDISQYPVYPWVLVKYNTETLDLRSEQTYRNLSKPIGVLNAERLSKILKLYKSDGKNDETNVMYRFHYSTSAYLIGFLIRVEPFTTLHISLQSGKFDHPMRLFNSIPYAYASISGISSDYREMIPEFFSTPDFLLNESHFDLGLLTDGTRVDDVILPPWAHNPAEFVAMNRLGLESSYVSEHLDEWIDLIFGYQNQGEEAVKALNLFHPYSYSSSITEDVLNDSFQLSLIQLHAANFGITPDQLFASKHPKREFIPSPNKLMSKTASMLVVKSVCSAGYGSNVLAFTLKGDSLLFLGFDGSIASFDMNTKMMQQYSSIDFRIPSNVIEHELFNNTVVMSGNTLLMSNKFSTEFTVFDVSEKKSKVILRANEHSVPLVCVSYSEFSDGSAFAATAAEDSSLIVWNISKRTIQARIVAHTVPIVYCDVSSICDIVASIDESGSLILSSLTNGLFIRNRRFNDPLYQPTHVKISSLGFVAVVFALVTDGQPKTKIVITDLRCRVLEEKIFDGELTSVEIIEMQDSSSFLVAAFDVKVVIMSVIDLSIRMQSLIKQKVRYMTYSKQKQQLFLLLDSGEILSSSLNI